MRSQGASSEEEPSSPDSKASSAPNVTPLFPNLFIVGAMKAGTSSLHEYLGRHPQIFMSAFKEPQYFAPHTLTWGQRWGQGNPYPEPGMEWYLRLFRPAGGTLYAGESSTSYTARPEHQDCEKRIFEFNPKARIIYLLRDPVYRAISHYWHNVRGGIENRPLSEAIRHNPEYLARSDYASQIEPYLKLFGTDSVFILTIEELTEHSEATFRRLFNWLGVDPGFRIVPDERLNVTPQIVHQSRFGFLRLNRLRSHWRWQRFEERYPNLPWRSLDRIIYRSIRISEIDHSEELIALKSLLLEPTSRLEHILNRTFSEWHSLQRSIRTVVDLLHKVRS
jgi:hypothetical protein